MLDLGKKYTTRDGRDVLSIYHLKFVSDSLSLIAEVRGEFGRVKAIFYTEEGKFNLTEDSEEISPNDLIEQPKKIFTMNLSRTTTEYSKTKIIAYTEDEAHDLAKEISEQQFSDLDWDVDYIEASTSDIESVRNV